MVTLTCLFILFLVIGSAVSLEDRPGNCTTLNDVNENKVIYCPLITDQSIELTIQQTTAKLTCYDNRTALLDLDVDLTNVTSLTIKNCHLPRNITELFDIWNIIDPQYVAFSGSKIPNGVIDAAYFRGFPKNNLKDLHIKYAGVETVDEGSFVGFDNLEILDFEHNDIRVVSDFFKYLPNLKYMDLQHNSIVELPEVITAPKLTRLHLQSNKLENLTSNLFSVATSIALLDISANSLRFISEDVLQPLKKLRQVSIGLGEEFNITTDFFMENIMLEEIRFRGGNITYISPNAFNNLTQLQSLNIYNSNIPDLRLGTFAKTYALRKLILGENRIANLEDGIFENLTNLTELNLTGNNLTNFSISYYKDGFKNLKTLLLDKNDFETIDRGSFVNLPKLETLSLARNKIKEMSNSAFDQQPSLTRLDLSSNKLTTDYLFAFSNFINLKVLNLDNNLYDEIPDVYRQHLVLKMANNNLTFLEVGNIINFSEVDVSANQIQQVSFVLVGQAIFPDQQYLLKLNINNNPILCDCSTLDLVKYMKGMLDTKIQNSIEIDARATNCQENLEGTPVKNLTLSDLTCKHNQCPKGCDCSIFPVNNTLEIDCSNLNLTKAPESINFAPFYHHAKINKCIVNLNDNLITNFEKNVNYENVTGLYLSNNNMRDVSWLPPKIEVLRLDNNLFTNLNETVLTLLGNCKNLSTLALHENPWVCDCSLMPFTNAVRVNLTEKLESRHKLLCAGTEENLTNLSQGDLCTDDAIIVTILYALLVIFLLSLTVLMILYHIYSQSVKIWLYSHSIFLWFVTEEELDKDKEFDAFVSYSHKDEDFIAKHLVPELESNSECPYKLCIHNRDWIVGEFIIRQIFESVSKSRRTIIVLSKNFLESVWAMEEFRTAYQQAMSEKRNRLIIIIYDDIDLNDIQDEELKTYIRMNTYIKWGDPWFFKRLRYAMPHKNQPRPQKSTRIDNMMISIDEKIDLTDTPTTPNSQTPPAISGDPLLLKVSPLQFKLSKDDKTTPPAECGMIGTHIC